MSPENIRKTVRDAHRSADASIREEVRDEGIRVLAAVAIRRRDQVLVIREEDEPNRHLWVFPQGYPGPGETLPEAARREAYEELGLDVELDGLLGVYDQFTEGEDRSRTHWVTVCYLAHAVQGAAPRPSREAIDFAWIDPTEVAAASMPAIRSALNDFARVGGKPGR